VLSLVGEEHGPFRPAALPSDDDFLTSTSMLLIDALHRHADHRLGGILVILSAVLLQQFDGNAFNLEVAQMHSAVSQGEPPMPHPSPPPSF